MSAFDSAGQEPGLEIWRIEDFEAVPFDQSQYGKFHVGDSYLVLKTYLKGSKLSHDLHFWLGEEASQDEYGTAAFKAVELDDHLGGGPVQHREVQDHESSLFGSYFKSGVKYLPGGVKSGFTHVDPEAVEKRLFMVKGKRNIKVKQVDLGISSLNKTDCFILDCGKGQDIFVYMPEGSSRMERFKGTQAANAIRDEDHSGEGEVKIIDAFSEESLLFFKALGDGGSSQDVAESSTEADDAIEPKSAVLYKVSANADGEVEIAVMGEKPLGKDMLDQDGLASEDCFVLDSGTTNGIFVWIGKESSKEERIQAMKSAESFLAQNELPKWTKIVRIVQNAETATFKQYFDTWSEPQEKSSGLSRMYSVEAIAEWDVGSLHAENSRRLAKSAGSAIGFRPDDSTGTKEIFRIEDFEMVPLDEDKYGLFFGGDSYVIKYEYEYEYSNCVFLPAYIVYFWQGGQSTADEKAASAINAVKLKNEVFHRFKAVQVQVVQGREPRHFLNMFDGKMVVFLGGKASGFKNITDHDTYDKDGTRLFRVRGVDCHGSSCTRAEQVEEVTSSLNTEDVFVLETPAKTFLWTGQASIEEELNIAKGIIELISPNRDLEVITEGSEPDDFWDALGGKGDYSRAAVNFDKPILEPRLFHCKEMSNGSLRALEINHFEKGDLVSDDVMILDSGDEIYVWIGNEVSDDEKKKGLGVAKKYLDLDPTYRNESNTLIFTIKEGDEPSSFTCIFPGSCIFKKRCSLSSCIFRNHLKCCSL